MTRAKWAFSTLTVAAIGALTVGAPSAGPLWLAQTLDVPEQIGASDPSVGVQMISPDDVGDRARVQQSGGRDLCGPTVSDEERLRLGVDCQALKERERALGETEAERPDYKNTLDNIDTLNLGEDVPATVILQQ